MSASRCTRTAVTLPSASAASSMSWICPRPWMVAWAFSLRPSVHRTGTWSCRATARAMSSSAYTSSFEPNPPPTAGAITRSLCSGMPVVAVSITLRMCGICVDDHTVTSPPWGCGTTATPRGSMAIGIRRCWT